MKIEPLHLIEALDLPSREDILHHARTSDIYGIFVREDGTEPILGWDVPTREQMAAAETRNPPPCLKCGNRHQPWGRCAPRTKEKAKKMAKDKSKKKKKKGKKGKVEEATPEVVSAPETGVDLPFLNELIASLDTASDRLKEVRDSLDAPQPEKSKKKGKSDPEPEDADDDSDDDESEDEDTDPEVKTYTEKALNKIGDQGAEGRKELVGILTSLGVDEDSLKGKRWTTLVSMILTKQETLASGDDDEFTADSADEDQDDDWDEDVPPAPEKKAKKKKRKKN